jgi:hypothetical protein
MAKNRKPKTVGQEQAHARQLLRRSNAAVPIPAAQHKRPRSAAKQALKREVW